MISVLLSVVLLATSSQAHALDCLSKITADFDDLRAGFGTDQFEGSLTARFEGARKFATDEEDGTYSRLGSRRGQVILAGKTDADGIPYIEARSKVEYWKTFFDRRIHLAQYEATAVRDYDLLCRHIVRSDETTVDFSNLHAWLSREKSAEFENYIAPNCGVVVEDENGKISRATIGRVKRELEKKGYSVEERREQPSQVEPRFRLVFEDMRSTFWKHIQRANLQETVFRGTRGDTAVAVAARGLSRNSAAYNAVQGLTTCQPFQP